MNEPGLPLRADFFVGLGREKEVNSTISHHTITPDVMTYEQYTTVHCINTSEPAHTIQLFASLHTILD